jgi:hypothetical protein
MQCSECGAPVEGDDRFCRGCGARLRPMTPAEKRREAMRQAKAIAREGSRAVQQGTKLARRGLKTQRGRSVAACSAMGAAAGAVLPVIGVGLGATIGAAAGFMRKL